LTGYQLLAADVDMSGTVTQKDIKDLRRVILALYSEFPFTNSWRFTEKSLKSKITDPLIATAKWFCKMIGFHQCR
jgi:hypothetical protein